MNHFNDSNSEMTAAQMAWCNNRVAEILSDVEAPTEDQIGSACDQASNELPESVK